MEQIDEEKEVIARGDHERDPNVDENNNNTTQVPMMRRVILHLFKYFNIVSYLLFIGAIGWFLCWPFVTKNIYYSENALSVFFHTPEFNQQDADYGVSILNQLKTLDSRSAKLDFRNQTYSAVESYLNSESIPFYSEMKRHEYSVERRYINRIENVRGENLYIAIRPGRGNGKESIILTVPYFKSESLAFSLALLKYISRVKWLNHDIILVISDGYEHNWAGEEAFIKSAAIPTGRMREAITLDLESFDFQQVAVLTEGVNGELPNLDMVNVVTGLLSESHYNMGRGGLPTFFKADLTATPNVDATMQQYPNYKDHVPAFIYLHHAFLEMIRSFGIDLPNSFMERSVIVLNHWYNQLISIPTGPHAWFRQQLTHAITLTNSVTQHTTKIGVMHTYYMMGRIMEISIRSLNNLIEELHQSFFLYYVTDSQHYYGFEHYLPNLLMFLGCLAIQFIGNYYASTASEKELAHAVIFVISNFANGVLIYLTPIILKDTLRHLALDSQQFATYWISIVVILVLSSLTLFYPVVNRIYEYLFKAKPNPIHWRYAKSLSIAFSGIMVGAIMIYSSALCIFLSSYLSILCILTTVFPTNIIAKLVQLVSLLAACPFNLIIVNILVRQHYFGEAISSQLEWFFTITDLPQNLFYISFCVVMIPTWTVLVGTSIISLFKQKEKVE
ncbi:predicted protein [Naegleria gruberi]|uniref:Predicted protein n=1 Tax=Naegleria gruberi TaxID=5762 RepID=D2VFN6_NAEGR|nr:uncharacterized protein NAEGRDRAFT_67688 [Naegleria gruberi]EFC44502.1 predicted protein [Naegleria gruberi]|eukprot:XP_002677246.1 predicted protein [Naegleria gruberi strain NEG-M]